MKEYRSNSSSSNPDTLPALQELRNICTHLYSAAEHYETTYLHSDQKLLVFDSLKDYSTKVFVNTLDHVGSVASQLNETLTRHAAEFSNLELRLSGIVQRSTTCHESMAFGSLQKWQHRRRKLPYYNKHHDPSLDLTIAEELPSPLLKLFTKAVRGAPADTDHSDSDVLRTLSWYLSTELSPVNARRNVRRNRNRSSSPAPRVKSTPTQRNYSRSLSSGQIFMVTHEFGASWRAHLSDDLMCRSNSLLSLMMSEEMEQEMDPDKTMLLSSQEENIGHNKD